jgi:hypothetical protein
VSEPCASITTAGGFPNATLTTLVTVLRETFPLTFPLLASDAYVEGWVDTVLTIDLARVSSRGFERAFYGAVATAMALAGAWVPRTRGLA